MNQHYPSSDASQHVSQRLSQHLGEPVQRRGRRRTLQRCSAVVATLLIGTSQCESGEQAAARADVAAASTEQVRVVVPGPDGTEAEGRCTQYEDLLMIHAPAVGWDVQRMSRLAWRESNCWADIRSRTSDSGLLQINDITLTFLNDTLGEPVDRSTLMDPVQNVRAAAALCTFWVSNGRSCYKPWTSR